jgi:hypothetical protein
MLMGTTVPLLGRPLLVQQCLELGAESVDPRMRCLQVLLVSELKFNMKYPLLILKKDSQQFGEDIDCSS